MDRWINTFESGLLFNRIVTALVLMVLGAFFAAVLVRSHIYQYLKWCHDRDATNHLFVLTFVVEGVMASQIKIGQVGVAKLTPVDAVGNPTVSSFILEGGPEWSCSPPELADLAPNGQVCAVTPKAAGAVQLAVKFKLAGKSEVTKSMMITIVPGDVMDFLMSFDVS